MTWPTRHDPKGKDYEYLKAIPWKRPERFLIEAEMVRQGGYLKGHGMGVVHHFKCAMAALWPSLDWYDRCPPQSQWSHLLVEQFVAEDQIAVLGPASSGKTYIASAFGLAFLWIWPQDTTLMTSTTTKDALDYRIFGSLTELFKDARKIRPWLEGHMVASKHRMPMKPVEAGDDDDENLTDKRDGVIGIACKLGDRWVGMSNYVGLKNKRVLLVADEAHLMAPGFLDSVANLRKNPTFKLIALGNPKDMTDPLGKAAEPAAEIGGWNGYAGEKKTSVWKTRAGGVAIQLCGTDTPNAQWPGLNPFPNIITTEAIARDLKEYGEDSLQMSMMNYGIMPQAGSSKRVIDILMCERHKAFHDPVWRDVADLKHVVGLDAAYSGTGGDRCVFTHLVFGHDVTGLQLLSFAEPQMIVPINPSLKIEPEEQIALWVMGACMERGIPASAFGLDSTGRGTLVSALARKWSPSVVPIEFGGLPDEDRQVSATDPRAEYEVYGKKVTALWYATRLIVQAGQFRRVPRDAIEEAQYREWTVTNNRRGGDAPLIDVEPKGEKSKLKKRGARSPDLWDSACVAVEMARRLGFQISGGVRIGIHRRETNHWLQTMKERQQKLRERHNLVYA